jgi:hypothetical protein
MAACPVVEESVTIFFCLRGGDKGHYKEDKGRKTHCEGLRFGRAVGLGLWWGICETECDFGAAGCGLWRKIEGLGVYKYSPVLK